MKMGKIIILIPFVIIIICQIAVANKHRKVQSVDEAREKVNEIKGILSNGNETGWKASFKSDFALMDDKDFNLGLVSESGKTRSFLRRPPPSRRIAPRPPGQPTPTLSTPLPPSYDARQIYGKKCPSFNHILRQTGCSNCFVTASMGMVNDRICMYQKEGEQQKFYSTKHMTTCVPKGCNSGLITDALDFWVTNGLVTGGDFQMNQPAGCQPFPNRPAEMNTTKCSQNCDDGSTFAANQRAYGRARYDIRTMNVQQIMREIFLYGPVVATMEVYEGFARYYRSGVYRKATDKLLGGHAVKLYGWGVENGTPFWLASNSWGPAWGDGGFFKIRRGTNECKIEERIYAALPDTAF